MLTKERQVFIFMGTQVHKPSKYSFPWREQAMPGDTQARELFIWVYHI